jgi:hypothetical protein
MAVTVELALLSRVSYGSLEITGSRLQGLLPLLAEDPHVGSGLPDRDLNFSRFPEGI